MPEHEDIEIRTEDGEAPAFLTRPEGEGPFKPVLFYMDAVGLRPTLRAMADRLASHGYVVLVPELYYRAGKYEPFDPKAVFGGETAERERLMGLVSSLDDETQMRDTRFWLETLVSRLDVRAGPVGCIGYCMGGGFALRAACEYPDRVAAALSFHGGRFVTDPAAPELVASRLKAAVYLGVAEVDHRHDAAVTERLEEAFTRAGVPHEIEMYAGATHGFAVPDLPVYDKGASERHWERMLEWLARYLP